MRTPKKISAKNTLICTLNDLLHAKPFHKISVNELCEAAQISRSAFYANFEDKYHLLACCLESTTEELDIRMTHCAPEDFILATLDHIQQNQRFYYNAFGAKLNEESMMILYRFFDEHLSAFLTQKEAKGFPLPGCIDIVSSFYVGGFVISTLKWIKSGYKYSKEEVAATHYNLMKNIL